MNSLTVGTRQGCVKGFENDGVKCWFGIPFAQPPIGDLRFKRAQEPLVRNGVLDCTKQAGVPIQCMNEHPMENEDCLNLNMWVPESEEKLPVFVWIYGGGFHFGYNDDKSYDGSEMAKKGVIRININYRIGAFGFYDFNQYDKSYDTNCALSDAIAALKWIKENIANFGGDPDNITIAGESAGGTMVYDLLACKAAQPYFHKAIVQSGLPKACGTRKFTSLMMPEVLKSLGVDLDNVATVRELDTAVIRKAQNEHYDSYTKNYPGIFMGGPFIGDDLIPVHPWVALANGVAKDKKVIFGYNKSEGDTFVTNSEFVKAWFPDFDVFKQMMISTGHGECFEPFKARYLDLNGGNEKAALSMAAGDYLFAIDSHRCADAQSAFNDTYVYRFEYVPVAYKYMGMGATHAVEVPFALRNTNRGHFSYALKGSPTDEVQKICDEMNGAWVNFAKTGNPNGAGIEWYKYEAQNKSVHTFNVNSENQEVYPDQQIKELWDTVGFPYDKI